MNPSYGQSRGWRALTAVAGVHGVVLLGLLSVEPVAEAVGLPRPLMVSLISVAEPEPAIEPPRPLPMQPRPVPATQPVVTPPILSVETATPTPIQAPPPPLEPQSLPVVLPAAEPAPVMVAATPPAPAPAPPTPPRFDADYLDNPTPAYPALSRRLGEQGRVLLRVYVNPDGAAAQVEVRESSGYARLDRVARDTVLRWRFVPARQGERAVAEWVLVPLTFSLRS